MKKNILIASAIILLAAGCSQQAKKNDKANESGKPKATSTEGAYRQNLPQGNKTGWETFSNSKYGFSIQYPKTEFKVYTDYNQVKPLSFIPACDETMVGCLFYSKDNQKGTNLESAGISLDKIPVNTEASCKMAQQGETSQGEQVINGANFVVYKGSGAATGHLEDYFNFRTFHNSDCIGITLRIASTNIGVYEPGTVKEFNKNELFNKLKQVLSTFKFEVKK